jgi:CDGSH-type Zn-finger protein
MQKATITPYRDGPYLIRGSFELVDQDGRMIETRRKTIALCRCGRSRIKPFCDAVVELIAEVQGKLKVVVCERVTHGADAREHRVGLRA